MEILVFVSLKIVQQKIIENKTLSKIVISFTKKIIAISIKIPPERGTLSEIKNFLCLELSILSNKILFFLKM